jgi:SagB-type dehydrogenase family enzyme
VKNRESRLCRSPYLIVYWNGDRLVFHNYSTGVLVSADPKAALILHFFDRWRSIPALTAHLTQFSPASLRAAVAGLVRHSLLIRHGQPIGMASAALRKWAPWNPAAGFFHLSTKDVPYSPEPTGPGLGRDSRMKRRLMPSPVKRYPRAPRHPLPPIDANGQFVDVLLARRTWRRFSRRPVSQNDLSTMLQLTFGVQKWMQLSGFRRAPLKTAPSGGARHPIEAYVLARRVRGLKPGLYHYAADRHELELLRREVGSRSVERYLPTQSWFNGAAAVVFMTAVFPRVQWRYAFARAYRVVLADAGHLCQTFCLTATWLGLAPFCTMALADSRIEEDLGIDGVTESVLYAAGVGARPADGRPQRPN